MSFFKIIKLASFKQAFRNEDSRFIMLTGLKVTFISLGINSFLYYFLYLIMRLNFAFFNAHGFPDFIGETSFYDSILSEVLENIPSLFAFHIYLYFIGCYLGWLILRPFTNLGLYSEKALENPDTIYKVDEFSTYKLFTRFSEFFFEYLREARKRGVLEAKSIPPQFSKIHKPIFDKVFMLHMSILLVIIAISSSFFIIENSNSIFQNMVDLGQKTLANQNATSRYFSYQLFILDEILNLTIAMICIFYLALGLHLYNKVSGAAFGIFSTMRSFMKGKCFSRVHLVGYAYVRDNTRKFNKYLDYVQNNLTKEKPKG